MPRSPWARVAVDTWRGWATSWSSSSPDSVDPRDYYEAAAIDGAPGSDVPAHHPAVARAGSRVTTVLNLLYGLKVFDIVFVLTNGGPGRATDTVYT
jgi:raffinose/stachyose/melibiose transport system permease protein